MTRAILDDDGENRAVRAFLGLYGTSSPTATQMRLHLKLSGYPFAPDWVDRSPGHLTKGGAQLWLRMLFDLEKPVAPTVAVTVAELELQAEQQAGPVGWVTMWPSIGGGGRKAIYSDGPEKPSYGPELDARLTIFPVYVHPAPSQERDKVDAERLAWLHSPASNNVDGWEWGIFKVRWDEAGEAASVLHTCANFSDLDAARAAGKEQG